LPLYKLFKKIENLSNFSGELTLEENIALPNLEKEEE
jgi:hypothetical protein